MPEDAEPGRMAACRCPYIPSLDVPGYATARRHLEEAGCRLVPAGSHSGAVYFQDPFGLVFDTIERS
jgi:hypothetical protein